MTDDLDTLRPEVREALVTIFEMLPYGQAQDKWRVISAELVRMADECAMHRKFVWTLLKAAGGSICVQPSVAVSFNHKTAVLDRIPEINGSVTFRASTSTRGKHND